MSGRGRTPRVRVRWRLLLGRGRWQIPGIIPSRGKDHFWAKRLAHVVHFETEKETDSNERSCQLTVRNYCGNRWPAFVARYHLSFFLSCLFLPLLLLEKTISGGSVSEKGRAYKVDVKELSKNRGVLLSVSPITTIHCTCHLAYKKRCPRPHSSYSTVCPSCERS